MADSRRGDFALEDSALKNSVLENSALEDSVLENSALEDSSLKNSALKNSALEDSALEDSALRIAGLGLMWQGVSRCGISRLGMGAITALLTLASPLPAPAAFLGTRTAAVPRSHALPSASAKLDRNRASGPAAGEAIAPIPSPVVWVWMPPPLSLMTPWRMGQRPDTAGEFRVVGDRIYGPDGVEFVANGINVNGYNWVWPGSTLADIDKIIEQWGFNSIRVNFRLYTDDPDLPYHTDNNDLDAMIRAFTQRGVVVMLDGHDFIGGYYEGQALEDLKAWYRDYAQRYRNNPYVWFNIANEPGNADSSRPENVQSVFTENYIIYSCQKRINQQQCQTKTQFQKGTYWKTNQNCFSFF